jgi:hypothetical protein
MLTPNEMKNRMHDLTRKEGYIDSIFNYCDRWCERCSFNKQCRNYAFREDDISGDGPALWDYLHGVLEGTILMLTEKMDKLGIDPETIDKMDSSEPDPRDNPLYQKAYKSAKDVADWMKNNLSPDTELSNEEPIPEVENKRTTDVLEVIYWYNFFISSKIYRALCNDDEEKPGEIQTDSNGSAKVALIAIDRSIAAWSVLMEEKPECQDEILAILVNLAEIRKQTELVFPLARKFIRPGFDE